MHATVVAGALNWCPSPNLFSLRVASNSPLNGNLIQGNSVGVVRLGSGNCGPGPSASSHISFEVDAIPFATEYFIDYGNPPQLYRSPTVTFSGLEQANWRITVGLCREVPDGRCARSQ
jgi:hypothetical protein